VTRTARRSNRAQWSRVLRRTRYATDGDQRIAYEVRSSVFARHRPWLVLVQGLGFDRDGWAPIARRLRREFRLVLIDNRGSGDSDPSPGRFQVAEMARDVVTVLDDVGIDRAHVLGLSLGGMIAQSLATNHPARIDRLVLAATTPGLPFGYPMPTRSAVLLATGSGMDAETKTRHNVENALSAQTVRHRPDLVRRLIAHVSARPTAQKAGSAQALAGARYFNRHGPEAISVRTLVLHGGADTVVDPRNARMLAQRIPDAELVILPGLGHLLLWEDPGAFVEAVTSFLLDGRTQDIPPQLDAIRTA
jgi:pimeloyl-ACP methyl ester carboxylesterase